MKVAAPPRTSQHVDVVSNVVPMTLNAPVFTDSFYFTLRDVCRNHEQAGGFRRDGGQ